MNINILLVLDKTNNTLYFIDVVKNYSNYIELYKTVLSATVLTQKDISIDEFVEFLTRRNKTPYKSDGYDIKDYTLFFI